MNMRFLIPAILFLVCLAIRSAYELLKKGRRIDPESKPIFAVIVTVMCALWISWFSLCPADPFRTDLPGAVRWTGLAIFLLGTILAVGGLIQLRGVENIDHLVTGGLFARIRHPMYSGFLAWLFGWSIYHGAFVSLAIGLPGMAGVMWWRRLEEAGLEKQFGDAYRDYRRTTWF